LPLSGQAGYVLFSFERADHVKIETLPGRLNLPK